MTPENWISITGIAVGAFVAIGLAIATGVGGVLAWFVQRGLKTLHEIREEVASLNIKLTEASVRGEHVIDRLDGHDEQLADHAGMLAEHGGVLAAIKAKVPMP